jgi:hypothetical protein
MLRPAEMAQDGLKNSTLRAWPSDFQGNAL